jgi:polyhydroxybutyrate depolymerase
VGNTVRVICLVLLGWTVGCAGEVIGSSDTAENTDTYTANTDTHSLADQGSDLLAPEVQEDTVPAPNYPDAPASVGGDRPSEYYVPATYQPATSWPLVVLLHGYSASGWLQNGYLGVSDLVDDKGFFLITPDGTKDEIGNHHWNVLEPGGVDDVGYIEALVDEMEAYFNIDRGRVYLLGHSNGGFLSYQVACTRPDLITAFVSLAGNMMSPIGTCKSGPPVGVLQAHGTADTTVSYYGIPGGFFGAKEGVEAWVNHNGCNPTSTTGQNLDLDAGVPGAETQVTHWDGCEGDVKVSLWKIVAGGHVPAFNSDFISLSLDFLLGQSR